MNYNFDHESDSETVQQTQTIQQPIVTLEYLLNQNKMKEIALSKATHLIELYKIELQVKEQDYLKQLELLKQTEKENYEALITELQQKILDLERQLRTQQNQMKEKQRVIKDYQRVIKDQQKKIGSQENTIKQFERKSNELLEIQRLNESGCRIPKMGRNNSGKDLSINKKGRYSQGKPVAMSQNKQGNSKQIGGSHGQNMRRSLSTLIYTNDLNKQQEIFRVEKTFLIDFLLRSEEKDEKIISELQKNLQCQQESILELKSSIKGNDRFMETFIKLLRQPSLQMENKLKNYHEVVKIQELIIEELNGQLNEYQTIFQLTNSSLVQIFNQDQSFNLTPSPFYIYENQPFQQCRQVIDQTNTHTLSKIKHHKTFIKQKIQNMETQNKELKRILQEMIKLIKNNQKINSLTLSHQKMTSFTNKNENSSSTFTNKNSRPTSFENTKVSSFGFGEEKISYGNISNLRTTQDISLSKQKVHSQTIHRR